MDIIVDSKIYSVSELNHLIREDLEGNFPSIWVEGEVSNFFFHSNRHMYFDLKDEKSKIKIVMFYRNNRDLLFDIEEGLHIQVKGYISVYEKRGEYQLVALEARPVGRGALILAFEQLKEKLSRKGFFDTSTKKKIPVLPGKIGIATSIGGAVLKDMVSILVRRFPNFHIIVRDVNVGGISSASELCSAIDDLCEYGVDVIIIARGGGSLEDMWGFNSEELACKIYNCNIPIISAVGHQTDFTISDFVADLRAATPSVAAEKVIVDKNETVDAIKNMTGFIYGKLFSLLKFSKKQLLMTINRKYFKRPEILFNASQQDFNGVYSELIEKISVIVINKKRKLIKNLSHIDEKSIISGIKYKKSDLKNMFAGWSRIVSNNIKDKNRYINYVTKSMEHNNPLNIVKRGFAVIYDTESRKNISTIKSAFPGNLIDILLKDGTIRARIAKIIFNKDEAG
jgi:exodeoxyribonuclease VII large subunit